MTITEAAAICGWYWVEDAGWAGGGYYCDHRNGAVRVARGWLPDRTIDQGGWRYFHGPPGVPLFATADEVVIWVADGSEEKIWKAMAREQRAADKRAELLRGGR